MKSVGLKKAMARGLVIMWAMTGVCVLILKPWTWQSEGRIVPPEDKGQRLAEMV